MEINILFKYVLEGLAVAIVAFLFTGKKTIMADIFKIAAGATSTFIVLDRFAPKVASSTRQGTGFGVGVNLVQ